MAPTDTDVQEIGLHADRRPVSPSIAQLPQPLQLVSMSNDFLNMRSRGTRNILNIRVNFNESHINVQASLSSFFLLYYINKKKVLLQVSDDETVEGVKLLIHSELGIPPCKQELFGWSSDRPPRDSTRLAALNLPKDIVLAHLRLL